MNAKQRRKKRRALLKSALFCTGQKVRFHHRYNESVDTSKVGVITNIIVCADTMTIKYEIDGEGKFPVAEYMLVENNKAPKRVLTK